MSLCNTFLFLGPLIHSSSAYILRTTYDSTNFFDTSSFTFYDGYDVFNHGFTLYKPKADAISSGIAKITTDDKIYLGVDTTSKLQNLVEGPGNGRGSIRLESADTFDNGLLIADFEHMPAGGCGLWPAYWLNHDGGDGYSEVDIIEGVVPQDFSDISLFTNQVPVCNVTDMGGTGMEYGTDCLLSAGGCHVVTTVDSFGPGFNKKNGGFFATQIETYGVKIWFFPRGTEPADIGAANPNPDAWGKPMMNYKATQCDMKNAFNKMAIILNTNFCGSWAGWAWKDFSKCQASTGVSTCEEYVAKNPAAFTEAYFLINSIKLYQMSLPNTQSSSAAASSTKMLSSATSSSKPTPKTTAAASSTLKSVAKPASTTTKKTAVQTPSSKKATTDASCGGTAGYTCVGGGYGNCCSQYGWCGSSALYCGEGCQKGFGSCT